MTPHAPPGCMDRRLAVALCAVAAVFAALFFLGWEKTHYHYDDAFITYTFARNLSRGYGFVFHPELPPVQGSSSFLHAVTLAALGALLPVEIHILGAIMGVVGYLLLMSAIAGLAALANPGLSHRVKVFIFLTGFFFQQPLLLSFGLETVWINAAMLWSLYFLIRKDAPLTAFLLALIPLLRLDYLFFYPVFLVFAWLVFRDGKRVVTLFLPGGAATLVYLVFSRLYFGEFVPHSWIAKAYFPASISGVINWQGFFSKYPVFLGLVTLGVGLTIAAFLGNTPAGRRRWIDREMALPLLGVSGICLTGFLYTLVLQSEGAPNMPWYYVTPVVFLYSALVIGLHHIRIRKRTFLYIALSAALVLCNVIHSGGISASFVRGIVDKRGHEDRREKIGKYLRDTIPGIEQKSVLCFEVGKIPYFSGAIVYDLLGLVSPQAVPGLMAADTTITFRRITPDYIAGIDNPDFFPMAFLSDEYFLRHYRILHQIDDYVIWEKIGEGNATP